MPILTARPRAGLAVGDAREAYAVSTANGAIGVLEPVELFDAATGTSTTVAEIRAYKEQGDTVIRFVSGDFAGPFLPGYEAAPGSPRSAAQSVGILRIDHVNGDSNDFMPALQYLSDALGAPRVVSAPFTSRPAARRLCGVDR